MILTICYTIFFNIIEKFKNRKGVKWYFRMLSGATPETWKLKKNKRVKCAFCGESFTDFIDHVLTTNFVSVFP